MLRYWRCVKYWTTSWCTRTKHCLEERFFTLTWDCGDQPYRNYVVRHQLYWRASYMWVVNNNNADKVIKIDIVQALGSKRIIVTYEVILSIQRLIKMNGSKLSEPSWDVICDILFAISENISFYGKTIFKQTSFRAFQFTAYLSQRKRAPWQKIILFRHRSTKPLISSKECYRKMK